MLLGALEDLALIPALLLGPLPLLLHLLPTWGLPLRRALADAPKGVPWVLVALLLGGSMQEDMVV